MNSTRRFCLDTNIFVSFLNQEEGRRQESQELIFSPGPGIDIIIPTPVVLELLVLVGKDLHQDLDERRKAIEKAQTWVYSLENVTFGLLTQEVADKAAWIIKNSIIKMPDALVLATAIVYGASVLYTWDEKLIAHAHTLPGLSVTVATPPAPAQLDIPPA